MLKFKVKKNNKANVNRQNLNLQPNMKTKHESSSNIKLDSERPYNRHTFPNTHTMFEDSPIITRTAPFKTKLFTFQANLDQKQKYSMNSKPQKRRESLKEAFNIDINDFLGNSEREAMKVNNNRVNDSTYQINSPTSSVSSMTASSISNNSTYYTMFKKKNNNKILTKDTISHADGSMTLNASRNKFIVGKSINYRNGEIMEINPNKKNGIPNTKYSTVSTQTDHLSWTFPSHTEKTRKPLHNIYSPFYEISTDSISNERPSPDTSISTFISKNTENDLIFKKIALPAVEPRTFKNAIYNDKNRKHHYPTQMSVSQSSNTTISPKKSNATRKINGTIPKDSIHFTTILNVNNSRRSLYHNTLARGVNESNLLQINGPLTGHNNLETTCQINDYDTMKSEKETVQQKKRNSRDNADVKFCIRPYTVKPDTLSRTVTSADSKNTYKLQSLPPMHNIRNTGKHNMYEGEVQYDGTTVNCKVGHTNKREPSISNVIKFNTFSKENVKTALKKELSGSLNRPSKNKRSSINKNGNDDEFHYVLRNKVDCDKGKLTKNKNIDGFHVSKMGQTRQSSIMHASIPELESRIEGILPRVSAKDDIKISSGEILRTSNTDKMNIRPPPPPPVPSIVFKYSEYSKPNKKKRNPIAKQKKIMVIDKHKTVNEDSQRALLLEEIRRARFDRDFYIVETADDKDSHVDYIQNESVTGSLLMASADSHQSSKVSMNIVSSKSDTSSVKIAKKCKSKRNEADFPLNHTTYHDRSNQAVTNGNKLQNTPDSVTNSHLPPPDYD